MYCKYLNLRLVKIVKISLKVFHQIITLQKRLNNLNYITKIFFIRKLINLV